ncbi:Endothelial cell-specific molecule 1, partial [Ophiophagus hannah]
MASFLVLTLLLVPMNVRATWSAKYAVDCPESCDSSECKNPQHCKRTVLDDCGCCRVCAAALGETCYRTVAGMDGVKCGPGLKCQFFSEEDDFGDEFGICKVKIDRNLRCLFGDIPQIALNPLSVGPDIWDLNIAEDHLIKKFLLSFKNDMGSGDGNSVEEDFMKEKDIHSPIMKWLNPR